MLPRCCADLAAQRLDLGPERIVFAQLAAEKPPGQRRLLRQPFGGEDIGVAPLGRRGAEVLDLDQSLFGQRGKVVIRPAEAEAELCGELALGDVRVLLEQAQHAEAERVGLRERGIAVVGLVQRVSYRTARESRSRSVLNITFDNPLCRR